MKRFRKVLCSIIAYVFLAVAVLGVALIATRAAGFWGALVSLLILPVATLAAPIYEIVKHGNWWPVLYVYGSSVLALVFFTMTNDVEGDVVPQTSRMEKKPVRRPFTVTAIGWFLIAWNVLTLIVFLPRLLFLASILPEVSVFLILGVAMLRGKNWARIGYLFVAPILLGVNLILGAFRRGVEDVLDLIPSLVVTLLVMVALLRPRVKAWFRGETMPPPI